MIHSLRKVAVGGIVAATLIALPACSGSAGPDAAKGDEFDVSQANRDGKVVVGFDLKNRSLDPLMATGAEDFMILAPIYDSLLRLAPSGDQLQPGLAAQWGSPDPLTVELTLQDGAKFSDGTPVDANAVQANLKRVRDANSPEMNNVVLQAINEVVVESPKEAVIKLSKPFAGDLVRTLAGPEGVMVSPAALSQGIDPASKPIGAGAYDVESYSPDRSLVLKRKDDYWDVDNWPLQRIEIKNVDLGNALVTALTSGDIQMAMSDDAAVLANLQKASGIGLRTAPGPFLHYLNFCKSRAPFDDPEVRKAFAQAVNRSALTEAVTAGKGVVARQAWADDSPNFNPEAVTDYDLEAAKKTLAGKTVDVNLSYLPIIAGHERVAEILQEQLAAAGFKLNLDPEETAADAFKPNHDAVLLASSIPGAGRVARQLGPNSVSNICGFESAEFNKLTAEIMSLDPTSAEAKDAWHKLSAMIDENTLMVPLYFQVNVMAFRSADVNAAGSSLAYIDFRNVYAK